MLVPLATSFHYLTSTLPFSRFPLDWTGLPAQPVAESRSHHHSQSYENSYMDCWDSRRYIRQRGQEGVQVCCAVFVRGVTSGYQFQEVQKDSIEKIQVRCRVTLHPAFNMSLCRFESRYVALYTEKETLSRELETLGREMEKLGEEMKREKERRGEVGRLEGEIEEREEKLGRKEGLRQEMTTDVSGLETQYSVLKNDTSLQLTAITADKKSKSVLESHIQTLQTRIDGEIEAVRDLKQRVKEAAERRNALERKRSDLMSSVESVRRDTETVTQETDRLDSEVHAIRGKLGREDKEMEGEFPVTERREYSPTSLLTREEARSHSLQLSLLDSESQLERLSITRSETHSKRLGLKQLLSKVEAKFTLAKKSDTGNSQNTAILTTQKTSLITEITRLKSVLHSQSLRKQELDSEMTRISTQFDHLQSHLTHCIAREKKVNEAKTLQIEKVKALRELKEKQVEEFREVKRRKQEVLAREMQVEMMGNQVLALRKELEELKEIIDESRQQADPEDPLLRLLTRDEEWQQRYHSLKTRLRDQAETLELRTERFSRANKPMK